MNNGLTTARAAVKRMMPIGQLVLKLIVAPTALFALTWWFLSAETTARLSHPNGLVFLAVILNEIGLVLTAIRMRGILAQFSIDIDVLRSIRIHFQSVFYFIIVPGSIGLELARYAKIRAIAPSTADFTIAISVLTDRFFGLLASLVLSVAMLPFIGLPAAHFVNGHAIALIGVAFVAATASFAAFRRFEFFQRLMFVSSKIFERPLRSAGLLALSVAAQCATAMAVFYAATSVGIVVSAPIILFVLSAAMFSMLLPVSFVGAGPAEAAAVGLLVILGVPASDALLIAALNYAARLLGGLQGGILEIMESGTAWHAVFGNKA